MQVRRVREGLGRVLHCAHERERIFVAAHIADERVTPDSLKGLQEHAPTDWADIVALAIHLDTRPRNLLAPRFLPGASV